MKELSEEIQNAVNELAKAMCQSEEFRTYKESKKLAVSDADKLLMIKKAHELGEKLNAVSDKDSQNDYVEGLVTEYEELMEDTVVYNYIKSENVVGKICRDVFAHIIDAMEF